MAKQTPNPNSRERLFLLDGMALAYRAYFSFISRPLINSRGENTSAVFGFVNTLLKILDEERPEHIAVVFDTKEPTFRHVMFQPYKATRQKMPDDMGYQIVMLKEVVDAFNVPCIEQPGYEADDIMGTLARRAEAQNVETRLVTGDKDFMQLISPLIKMYRPGKRGDEWEILDERAVMEKFGVTPDRVIDVLGLIGDKSDNVPGVMGIGEKTAIPLVQQYGTIENILDRVNDIPQKGIRQKLIDHHDQALLSKKLVTIDVNVPLKIDFHKLSAKPKNIPKLVEIFEALEFRTLIKRITTEREESASASTEEDVDFDVSKLDLTDISNDEHVYHIVKTKDDLRLLAETLSGEKSFVFDTETTALDPMNAELLGLSFSVKSREAWYVPMKLSKEFIAQRQVDGNGSNADVPVEDDAKKAKRKTKKGLKLALDLELNEGAVPAPVEVTVAIPEQFGLDPKTVFKTLAPVFGDAAITKVGQNVKYDLMALASQGIAVNGPIFDTMIANYVLRPDSRHNLDVMAADHLNYKMISFDDLTGTGRDRKAIHEIEMERVAEYSAEDADMTRRLYDVLKAKLKEEKLLDLCNDIEFPLVRILADIEMTGIALDTKYLDDLAKELERNLENLKRDIFHAAGEEFNLNSTQQLGKLLFEKLGLTALRKTKTGYSTDVWTLEELRHKHPVVELMLEYRQLQKLKSTYVDALPQLVNPKTNRVHTSFNQTVASTGRLSSSNPNLQNIPIRTEIGRSIRKAFIPGGKNKLILSADYSQIELRIMAHISGDGALVDAFRNNEDIHATTAARVFGVAPEKVTKEMRRKSKEVNYGIMYGIGPFGLANRLDITQAEAKELISRYFERFPKVREYINMTLERARKDGYTSTLQGRRRYFADINSRNFSVRSNAERQAINMPIQGTAADMIKLAMIRIHRGLKEEEIDATMLLQVHDELVFEVAKNDEWRAKSLIVEQMKNALPLSVPIEVEAGSGKNWLEAH